MSRHTGIPLLSGPPGPHPGTDHKSCRKCGKEFNIIFHRQRKCMHCGYGYCSSCTDYQALMPRAHGYDLASVCAYCIEMLNITALGRAQLRSLPLAKLRRYTAAYDIPTKNAIDKNDLVDAAVAARTPQGCLPPVYEDYYRKHSVPSFFTPGSSSPSSTNRNSSAHGFSSTDTNTSSRSPRSFPRPDLDPNRRQHPQDTAYGNFHTTRARTASAPTTPRTAHRTSEEPNASRPTSSFGRPSSPYPNATHTSSQSHSAVPMPPPPMSTLVTLPRSALSALSVGTLKQILFEARVRVPPGVVEKEELVERAWALVEEEKRKDNEGMDDYGTFAEEDDVGSVEAPDREEEVVVEMVDPGLETRTDTTHEHSQRNDHRYATASGMEHGQHPGHSFGFAMGSDLPSSRSPSSKPSTSPTPKQKPRSHPKPTNAERSGLCVICQDEEANIAVVDCGHLSMCRECSELVLASSRECPLCRTRIVTESRLLRIFKT